MTETEPLRGNWPHDSPDARGLVEAVRDYLADDLGPRAEGRDRWQLRIAANALSIAARELELGPVHAAAHASRLEALGATDERSLALAVRSGALDDRRPGLTRALWDTTLDKLAVANPTYRDPTAEPPTLP